jgi:hypothetical protein
MNHDVIAAPAGDRLGNRFRDVLGGVVPERDPFVVAHDPVLELSSGTT